MSDEETNPEGGDSQPTGVTLSQDEYNQMIATVRDASAIQAGFDTNNPTTSLVMQSEWKPGMSADDLKAIGEKYGILKSESSTPNDSGQQTQAPQPGEIVGPEGVMGATQLRQSLGLGSSVPDVPLPASPKEIAKHAFDQEVSRSGSREEGRVAAIDALLKMSAVQGAHARINARREEEALVAAFQAGQMAQGG